jgi:hypothetical protein
MLKNWTEMSLLLPPHQIRYAIMNLTPGPNVWYHNEQCQAEDIKVGKVSYWAPNCGVTSLTFQHTRMHTSVFDGCETSSISPYGLMLSIIQTNMKPTAWIRSIFSVHSEEELSCHLWLINQPTNQPTEHRSRVDPHNAAMQDSASESNVRYYPTWKHSPLKEKDEQGCYNA